VKAWSYASAAPFDFMAWCLFRHQKNFVFTLTFTFTFDIIIIGSTALGGPWPNQANVTNTVHPVYPTGSFYNPIPFRLPVPSQSILISVGHVRVDLQGLSTIQGAYNLSEDFVTP
jgi:hypothetical protein